MTQFQLWSAILTVLALGVSALSYANAWRARKISSEALETSKSSLEVSRKSLSINERQSKPHLSFSCDAVVDGSWLDIALIITNSGKEPTKIHFGNVTFKSD